MLTIWIRTCLCEPEQWIEARAQAQVDRTRQTGRLGDLFHRDLLRPTLVGLALATVGLATFWGVYVRGQSLLRELAEDARIGTDTSRLDPHQRRLALDALCSSGKAA
jgi:hypothetical protein